MLLDFGYVAVYFTQASIWSEDANQIWMTNVEVSMNLE